MATCPIDIQLLVHAILYFTAAGTGLVISVPTGITFDNFDGNCILYGEVNWINSTSFQYSYGSSAACHFVVYATVIVGIMYAFGMGCYYAYAVIRSRKDETIGSQMWVMPFILSNSLVTVIMFISACIISLGFSDWCKSFMSGKDKYQANINSCADGQDKKWHWNTKPGSNVNPETYFSFMTTAHSAAWVAVVMWLAQVVLTIIRFWRNRRERSKGTAQEDPTSDRTDISRVEPTA